MQRKGGIGFKIFLVVLLIILLVALGCLSYFLYMNYQINKAIELEKDDLYLTVKCIEFCPYREYELGTWLNVDCMFECDKINSKEIDSQQEIIFDKIKNAFFASYFKEKYYRVGEEEILPLVNAECWIASTKGDKSCLSEYLLLLEKNSDAEFKVPVYTNVTISLQNATCNENEVIAKVNFIEGDIEGVYFVLESKGSSKSVKRTNIQKGLNEIIIQRNEISNFGKVDKVGLSYILDGETLSIVSKKEC